MNKLEWEEPVAEKSHLLYKATIAATVTTTILATVDAADEADGVCVKVTLGDAAAVGAATSTVMG